MKIKFKTQKFAYEFDENIAIELGVQMKTKQKNKFKMIK